MHRDCQNWPPPQVDSPSHSPIWPGWTQSWATEARNQACGARGGWGLSAHHSMGWELAATQDMRNRGRQVKKSLSSLCGMPLTLHRHSSGWGLACSHPRECQCLHRMELAPTLTSASITLNSQQLGVPCDGDKGTHEGGDLLTPPLWVLFPHQDPSSYELGVAESSREGGEWVNLPPRRMIRIKNSHVPRPDFGNWG